MAYKLLPAPKLIQHFQNILNSIRGNRVNASVLDNVLVEAYGSRMHIREIATVTVPEPSQLLITPFDKGLIKDIVKAINEANLGVNPADDGAGVRLNFPPMTEETRKLRVKELHKLLEQEARVPLRSVRQDLLKGMKAQKEASQISEDELKRFEKDLQNEVDQLNDEFEKMTKAKEDEIMKV